MAAVRGMGVAVITRTSGTAAPFSRRAARCSTPNRCCSSMTATPRERKATRSSSRAWVPMTMSTSPALRAVPSRLRSAAVVRLVSSSTRNGRSPNRSSPSVGTVKCWSSAFTFRWCCSASTSVGAIRAPWWPPCTATSRALTATRVLPDPTSPCSNRCMGTGAARSASTSAMARSLRPGEGERQVVEEAADQVAAQVVGHAHRGPFELALAPDERDLHPQQLVEHQPAPGRGRLAERVRPVDAVQGGAAPDEAELVEQLPGHGLVELAGPAQRLLDPAADLPGGQARLLRLGVDGDDPSGAVAHEVDHRVGHLAAALELLELAEDDGGGPLLELGRPPRLVEEGAPQVARAVGQSTCTMVRRLRVRRVATLRTLARTMASSPMARSPMCAWFVRSM